MVIVPPAPYSSVSRMHGRSPSTSSSAKTLDLEHSSSLRKLGSCRVAMDAVKQSLKTAEAAISEIESKGRQTLTDADFCTLGMAYERRHNLVQECDDMSIKCDEVAYYMRTARTLFKYYDVLEKGSDAGCCAKPPMTACPSNSILRYFTGGGGGRHAGADGDADPANAPMSDDRASLLERYMQFANSECPLTRRPPHGDQQPHRPDDGAHHHGGGSGGGHHAIATDACPHCRKRERTVMLQDGYVFCNACFTVEYILVDHDKPSYKDPPKEIAYFAYKRINHFNEWLNQVQGKETTEIPDDVYDNILLEIKKQKLVNMADLTRKKVKEILKKLRINKYYEHIPHIINRLNGMPSPHFPPDLEERLRHMFCQIQVPFLKFSPSQRKNFLSYSFCLHKMMQLLEKDQYLESFPLLKSREKLHQQDMIWQKICADLGWDFIPSM